MRVLKRSLFALWILMSSFSVMDVRQTTARLEGIDFNWKLLTGYNNHSDGLDWSPDSRYLAFGNEEATGISILNVESQQIEKEFDLPAYTSEYRISLYLRWNPDSSYLAVIRDFQVIILDAEDGDVIQLGTEDWSGSSLAWLDASRVAILNTRGQIYIIDLPATALVQEIELDKVHLDPFVNFAWNRQHNLFAVPQARTTSIVFWSGRGKLIETLLQNQNNDNIDPTSQCDVGRFDGLIKDINHELRDLQWSNRGEKLGVNYGGIITICTFSDDLTQINDVFQLHLLNEAYDPNHTGMSDESPYIPVDMIAWSSDDHWLVTNLAPFLLDECGIAMFDMFINDPPPRMTAEGICQITNIAWSPDGRLLAAVNSSGIWLGVHNLT